MRQAFVHTFPEHLSFRPGIFTALVKLFHESQYLDKDSEEDPDAGLTAIDHEEQNAGYQASYSRLAASEAVAVDPVAYIRDPKEYLGQELVRLSKSDGRVKTLLAAGDPNIVGPFIQSLSASGYVI